MTDLVLAEVVGVNDSYQYDSSKTSRLFSISVRTISDNIEKIYNDVLPASLNNLQIPLIGEHVLIFKGISYLDSNDAKVYRWYFMPHYNLQSSINHSLSPGVAYDPTTITNTDLLESNQTFKERVISPLQPFEGDNIYQGRFGNTIRLGSTTSAINAYKSPNWSGDNDGDPIIVISNTKRNLPNKEYVVEDLNSDYSSLWLTSTQRVTNLKFNIDLTKSSTNSFSSQFIGSADRVILQSKTDVVALDGKKAIELNSPMITLGQNTKKEGLLYSDKVIKAFYKLVEIINGLQAGNTPVSPTPFGVTAIQELYQLISEMKNDNIRIDKPQS